MKKRFLVMLTATIYVVQALLLYILSPVLLFIKTTNPPLPVSKYLLIVFFLLSIIFIVVNIVTAFLELRNSNNSTQKIPLGTIMGFKLALIPFFISHSYWFILAMGGTANPFLMILWFVIPFLFLFYALSGFILHFVLFDCTNTKITQKWCSYKGTMYFTYHDAVIVLYRCSRFCIFIF